MSIVFSTFLSTQNTYIFFVDSRMIESCFSNNAKRIGHVHLLEYLMAKHRRIASLSLCSCSNIYFKYEEGEDTHFFGCFSFSFMHYAFCELPNSRILPITVALIASRIGVKYLRGSYTSVSAASASRTAFVP